jgi:hypothetical protein
MISLTWDDSEPTSKGPGVDRPAEGAATSLYHMRVYLARLAPMKVALRAESRKHAKRYAETRWPGARVELA